ncbi:MAG: flagellar biosynthetic protein FliR [Syntrophaceae bacterium]|nr:flagellar biosynthetic protein FliR [Syntrophaceae bacterium]
MTFPLPPQATVLLFILLFLRVSAMVIVIPVLGETMVPGRVKACLVILMTFLIFPTLRIDPPPIHPDLGLITLAFAMAGEILIGIVIGATARFIFAGIQLAGSVIGMQMGFAMSNVLDPLTRANVMVISEFQYMIAMLIFLAVDGHHIFIMAIADSYRILPPLGIHFSAPLMEFLLTLFGAIFVTAVKVAAPVMAVLLFTNVALGIVARTVPQINVFMVGFPIQVATGLIIFGLTAPLFAQLVQRAISGLPGQIRAVLQLMAM